MNTNESFSFIKKGWQRAVPFVLLFVYLIIIYQTVPVLWDDYSFASLSWWGYTQPDVSGTAWSLQQLLSFCVFAYRNFIGRIFFMIFVNDLLIRHLWLYRIIAALFVTILYYMLYRFSGVPRKTQYAYAMCISYGLLSRRMYTDTLYYWAGVNSYIIPLVFMFGGIFLYRKIRRAKKVSPLSVALLFVFSVLTCLSQEQICFTYCFTIGFLCLTDFLKTFRLKLYQWAVLIVCGLFAICLFLAPGNFNRLSIQGGLKEATFLLQICKNLRMTFAIFYQKDNMLFVIVFVAFICYLAYCEEKSAIALTDKSTARIPYFFLITCLWSVSIVMKSIFCWADATVFSWDSTSANDMYLISMMLYSVFGGILIYRQIKRISDKYLSMYCLAATISVIVTCFYSYYIAVRMVVTLIFALFMVMINTFSTITPKKRAIVMASVSIASCAWLMFFMVGYYGNSTILRNNDRILREIGTALRAGEEIDDSELSEAWNMYFLPERVYAHDADRGVAQYYDFPETDYFIPSPISVVYNHKPDLKGLKPGKDGNLSYAIDVLIKEPGFYCAGWAFTEDQEEYEAYIRIDDLYYKCQMSEGVDVKEAYDLTEDTDVRFSLYLPAPMELREGKDEEKEEDEREIRLLLVMDNEYYEVQVEAEESAEDDSEDSNDSESAKENRNR